MAQLVTPMLMQKAVMRALSEMTSRILPRWTFFPSVIFRIPIWILKLCSWNLLFPHPQGDSGMTKLGGLETHSAINYYPGPLNDAVCQMERVMRWETWSTTCGVIRSILLLAVSWLPWQHPCCRVLWLCERCGDKFVAVLRLKDPISRGSALCFYEYPGRVWRCHLEAIGLCGSKAYFNAGLWGVGKEKRRTGLFYLFLLLSSSISASEGWAWASGSKYLGKTSCSEVSSFSGMLGDGAELAH